MAVYKLDQHESGPTTHWCATRIETISVAKGWEHQSANQKAMGSIRTDEANENFFDSQCHTEKLQIFTSDYFS